MLLINKHGYYRSMVQLQMDRNHPGPVYNLDHAELDHSLHDASAGGMNSDINRVKLSYD